MLSSPHDPQTRLSIGFLNWAHALDHFVLLVFPTVVIGMEAVYGRPYSELIVLGTASFAAFGIFSLPAGWLADRWSRRNMMILFFIGSGASMVAAAAATSFGALAAALFALGMFAAVYHPVGMAMLIDISGARGRTLAFNGVCGNLGVSLAAGITAALTSWFGWRGAFLAPAALCVVSGFAYWALVADDRPKGGKRSTVADVVMSRGTAILVFGLYIVISLSSGLVFNTMTVALPKIVDERIGQGLSLLAVGGLATAVFLCGAIAQLAMGRLVERYSAPLLFAGVVVVQFVAVVWAGYATGLALVAALALSMAMIYGQVTAGDIVVARYTADAWRGRIYAVRYFLTFTTSAVAVYAIGVLHARGGFDLVLAAIAVIAAALLVSVLGFVALTYRPRAAREGAVQPAE
jgi:MFS family permease